MLPFLDIHCHNPFKYKNKNVVSVSSISYGSSSSLTIPKDIYWHSVAVHPWDVQEFSSLDSLNFEKDLGHPRCIMIGETGLDRARANFELQQEFFLKHLEIAKRLALPVMLHCVRAYNEVQRLLSKVNLRAPVIFHDYHGTLQETQTLMSKNCYFSFGPRLTHASTKLLEALKEIPSSRIFLETDDASIHIREVYECYSSLAGIKMEDLKLEILDNAKIFSRLLINF